MKSTIDLLWDKNKDYIMDLVKKESVMYEYRDEEKVRAIEKIIRYAYAKGKESGYRVGFQKGEEFEKKRQIEHCYEDELIVEVMND